MSKTLKLSEQLLERGRTFTRLGREGEALRVLGKLARFAELPADVADGAGSQLAEIHLRRGNFPKARRHLAAGLARRPKNARLHFLMAGGLMDDEDGDTERALQHYHLAVRLDPGNADYHCDYGRCLLSVGDDVEGVKHLHRAVKLAPETVKYLRALALALLQTGRADAARQHVLAMLFRNPRDPELRVLWNELRFQEAHQGQQRDRFRWALTADGGPVLLPFKATDSRKPRTRHAAPATVRLSAISARNTTPKSKRQNP